MDENVFVIIINPDDSTYTDTINSASEIKGERSQDYWNI